jgi:hypothetical protein
MCCKTCHDNIDTDQAEKEESNEPYYDENRDQLEE